MKHTRSLPYVSLEYMRQKQHSLYAADNTMPSSRDHNTHYKARSNWWSTVSLFCVWTLQYTIVNNARKRCCRREFRLIAVLSQPLTPQNWGELEMTDIDQTYFSEVRAVGISNETKIVSIGRSAWRRHIQQIKKHNYTTKLGLLERKHDWHCPQRTSKYDLS